MKGDNTLKVVLKEASNIIVISAVWVTIAGIGMYMLTPIVAIFTKLIVNSWKVFYNLI